MHPRWQNVLANAALELSSQIILGNWMAFNFWFSDFDDLILPRTGFCSARIERSQQTVHTPGKRRQCQPTSSAAAHDPGGDWPNLCAHANLSSDAVDDSGGETEMIRVDVHSSFVKS
jgi:hypothetical protein